MLHLPDNIASCILLFINRSLIRFIHLLRFTINSKTMSNKNANPSYDKKYNSLSHNILTAHLGEPLDLVYLGRLEPQNQRDNAPTKNIDAAILPSPIEISVGSKKNPFH